MMAMGLTGASSEPRGDDFDDLRKALRYGKDFDPTQVARLLDRLTDSERRLRVLTRPEAVDFREVDGVPHVVLRCRACMSEFMGGTQESFLAAPPAPCE